MLDKSKEYYEEIGTEPWVYLQNGKRFNSKGEEVNKKGNVIEAGVEPAAEVVRDVVGDESPTVKPLAWKDQPESAENKEDLLLIDRIKIENSFDSNFITKKEIVDELSKRKVVGWSASMKRGSLIRILKRELGLE